MRRRDFVKVIIGSAAAWPLAARAQQPAGRLPTIGFLGGDASVWRSWTAIFVARLRELGWIEDRTVAIEYRWSEGRPERIAEVAAEFVRLKVDVILTNNLSTPTMKEATSVIPIVFVLGNDPVGDGFVASLARPGGNVTGVSTQQTETASKALEILRQIVPRIGRVAILANTGNLSAARQAHGLQAAASALGLETVALEIRPRRISPPPSRHSTSIQMPSTSCRMRSSPQMLRAS
jgi:putative ABC transport system substrate-binding protein